MMLQLRPKRLDRSRPRALLFLSFFLGVFLLFHFLPVSLAESPDKDPLTTRQRRWLDAHKGQLTLAFQPDWPPASFFAEGGQVRGITPEYISLIEKKLGFQFKRVGYGTWAETLQAAYDGKVDMIPAMARTLERENTLHFTRPYFQVPTTIVTGQGPGGILSLDDMEGKRVCVLRGSADHQMLAKTHPEIHLVPVDYVQDGLRMVSMNEVEALVADVASTSYLIEKNGLSRLQSVGYTHYNYEIAMGISAKHPILVEIMNRALTLVSPEEKREIFKKWLYPETSPFYQEPMFRVYAVGLLVVMGGGILVVILLWNRSLRLAVERTTRVSRKAEASLRAQAEELERARQRVNCSNLELTQVFNASPPMLIIDGDFRLLRMNRTFSELFGVDPSTITGKRCHEVVEGAMCRTDDCPLVQALSGREPQRGESIFSAAGGEGIPCMVSANTLTDESGQFVGIVHSFTDISRLLQAEEEKEELQAQLRHSQKMEAIGTLAGGIAHDFNNILSPIIGYADMTRVSLPPDSMEAKNMEGILKAAQRARNLVRQILTLSRRHQPELKPVHAQAVVKEALTLLRHTIPSTIAITTHLNADGCLIQADPTQVHQIIMNLCTNAYHAMEGQGGGVLEVSLDRVPVDEEIASTMGRKCVSCLRIRVRDTGIGMDAAHRHRIFDPYFTTKGEGKGTGLGLSVVHGIVRERGGTVTVASEPGAGTTFTLCFPEVEDKDRVPEPERVGGLPTGRETVLVVDDEEEVVILLKQMLSRAGYKVTATTESRKARALYRANPDAFELVVTDMTMPDLTGCDLANEIKSMTPMTPVIICTGHSDRLACDKAEKIGVGTFLMKPVDMNTLLTAVRQELDQRDKRNPLPLMAEHG